MRQHQEGLQSGLFWLLAILAMGATGILSRSESTLFQKYFGHFNPLILMALLTGLGFLSLAVLQINHAFSIHKGPESLTGIVKATGMATVLALIVILVDIRIGYPQTINVPFPHSLLFYPAIAYVAEIVFHVLPLTFLLLGIQQLFKPIHLSRLVWPIIIAIASLEPTLQVIWSLEETPSLWLEIYTGLHIFIFNLLQLWIFRRYDFISMYSFRLVYYILWHIIWGHLRLTLLF